MNIAIDESPLKSGHYLQHSVRGTGFYLNNLKKALLENYPDDQFSFVSQGETLAKNIDILHIPYFEPFFLTLPFKKQTKTVLTIHDLTPLVMPDLFPSGVKGRFRWLIQRWNTKKMDAIIADSQSSKNDIHNIIGISEEKIHVVYLAAGEEFRIIKNNSQKEEVRKKFNLPEKFVLYVGDITPNKNVPRLIEATKELGISLVLVGKAIANKEFDHNNPWNADLVKLQELIKNDENIHLLGFISSEDLVSLYNIATIFVLPSLYEGFGLPVLEAMSCGCPVVTSKNSSLKEIAGDAALFIDPNDANSIKKGIENLLSDSSARRKLIEKGLSQSKKFTWDKTAQDTMDVYKKVLDR